MQTEAATERLPLLPPGFPPGWAEALGAEFQKPYFERLREALRREQKDGHQTFPPLDNVLRAFRMVDLPQVRVVILGQDPYHGSGEANGLSFAVENGVKTPPSLRNIFKEISTDLGVTPPKDTTLLGWAQQGVLLLNTVLTVRKDTPMSHRGLGWETFTDAAISALNASPNPMVFLLWGSQAHAKTSLITNPCHAVLKTVHPSPLSASRGWFGSRVFSRTNDALQTWGYAPIRWEQTAATLG